MYSQNKLSKSNKSHTQSSSSILSTSQNPFSKTKQKPLCKISVNLQQNQYNLSVYSNSTIKKLALKLIIMLYDNLLQDQFNQQFNMIHQQICQLLVQRIRQTIQNQQKENNKEWKKKLNHIIQEYYQYKSMIQRKINNQSSKKYFLKNYLTTLSQTSDLQSGSELKIQKLHKNEQQFPSYSPNKSPVKFQLYQKGKKSIEKKQNKIKQSKQSKSKLQISYCTFHPNIQKSQKKFKSKQKSNVFQRLYSDSQQIKSKLLFKKNQILNQQQKKLSSYDYVPKINQCSKEIVKMKSKEMQLSRLENQNYDFHNQNQQQSCENTNFLQSFGRDKNSNSLKYLLPQSKRKNKLNSSNSTFIKKNIFDSLSDSNFYQNRFNKTIVKHQLDFQTNHPFQPQLSQGTKRIVKNFPSHQKRMKMYEIKKAQNTCSSPNFFSSKEKQINRSKLKNKQNIQHINRDYEKNSSFSTSIKGTKSKGVKSFLARIKTEPLQDITMSQNNQLRKNQEKQKNRYKSQIFKLQNSFINDDSSVYWQISPQKLDLQNGKINKKNQNNSSNYNFKKSKTNNIQPPENLYHLNQNQQKTHFIQQKTPKSSSLQQIKSKQDIFNKIFDFLLSKTKSHKQIVSSDIAGNKDIPLNIKTMFQPLTKELQEMDTSLDQQQFIWSLQNLYQQLDFQKKAVLLTWGLRICKMRKRNQKQNLSKIQNYLQHVKTDDSIFELID